MCAGLQAQRQGLAEQLLEGLHVPGPDGSHQEHWSPHGLPQRGAPNLMCCFVFVHRCDTFHIGDLLHICFCTIPVCLT